MTKMKYKEIYYIAVPPAKQKEEKYNIWVHLAVRPLSVLATMPLLKTRVNPTKITAVSIICSIVGFFAVSFSQVLQIRILGWCLFFVWAVLDGVDGNYARCSDQCSQLGDLWDTTGGYAAMVLIYSACGICAFFDNNLITLFEPFYYLIIGGASAIFSIFPRLVMHKKKSYGNDSAEITMLSDKKSFGLTQIVAMNFISPSGFLQVIMLGSIILHITNIFTVFYCGMNLMIMSLSLYKLLR